MIIETGSDAWNTQNLYDNTSTSKAALHVPALGKYGRAATTLLGRLQMLLVQPTVLARLPRTCAARRQALLVERCNPRDLKRPPSHCPHYMFRYEEGLNITLLQSTKRTNPPSMSSIIGLCTTTVLIHKSSSIFIRSMAAVRSYSHGQKALHSSRRWPKEISTESHPLPAAQDQRKATLQAAGKSLQGPAIPSLFFCCQTSSLCFVWVRAPKGYAVTPVPCCAPVFEHGLLDGLCTRDYEEARACYAAISALNAFPHRYVKAFPDVLAKRRRCVGAARAAKASWPIAGARRCTVCGGCLVERSDWLKLLKLNPL